MIVWTWKDRARKLGIAAGDIELTGSAFSALDDGRGGSPITMRFIGQRSVVRKRHELKEESAQAVTRRVVGTLTQLLRIREAPCERVSGFVRSVTGNSLADTVKSVTRDGFLSPNCGVAWGEQDRA